MQEPTSDLRRNLAGELRRKTLLRTPVSVGKNKGRDLLDGPGGPEPYERNRCAEHGEDVHRHAWRYTRPTGVPKIAPPENPRIG